MFIVWLVQQLQQLQSRLSWRFFSCTLTASPWSPRGWSQQVWSPQQSQESRCWPEVDSQYCRLNAFKLIGYLRARGRLSRVKSDCFISDLLPDRNTWFIIVSIFRQAILTADLRLRWIEGFQTSVTCLTSKSSLRFISRMSCTIVFSSPCSIPNLSEMRDTSLATEMADNFRAKSVDNFRLTRMEDLRLVAIIWKWRV